MYSLPPNPLPAQGDDAMAGKKSSYRNPFLSALLFAFLYLVISNFFYWVYNGRLSFVPFHYYQWVEHALGTIVMGVSVLVVEFIRNRLGRAS